MKSSLKRWSHLLERSSPYSIHSSLNAYTRQDGRYRPQSTNFVGMALSNQEQEPEWGGLNPERNHPIPACP
eukprot:8781476-Prorocentrum_lima.AAC.1